ncbi:MAG: hypothetical protein E6Q97_27265 [Desulfurellales bacterium]|nr:MAG: hypothetical protein E6Q97_27265 [Desulfurellales bacterium]
MTIFTWHPIDGAAVKVELHKHPGAANQSRVVLVDKTIGFVWQRSVAGFKTVWSYRHAEDTLGIMRGSCRDRDEALSRLMFEARDRGVGGDVDATRYV